MVVVVLGSANRGRRAVGRADGVGRPSLGRRRGGDNEDSRAARTLRDQVSRDDRHDRHFRRIADRETNKAERRGAPSHESNAQADEAEKGEG